LFAIIWSGFSLIDYGSFHCRLLRGTSFDCSSTSGFNERNSPQLEVERETRASSSAAARLIDLNWQSSRLRTSDRFEPIRYRLAQASEWVILLSPRTHNSYYLRNKVHFVTKHKLSHYVVLSCRWLAISNRHSRFSLFDTITYVYISSSFMCVTMKCIFGSICSIKIYVLLNSDKIYIHTYISYSSKIYINL